MEGTNTSNACRIGYLNHEHFHHEAGELAQALRAKSSKAELVSIPLDEPLNWLHRSQLKPLQDALLSAQIDIGVVYLPWLPTSPLQTLKTGALAPRSSAADCLIFRPEVANPDTPMQLKKGATIGICSARHEALLGDLRPDLNFSPVGDSLHLRRRALDQQEVDAIVCLELESPALLAADSTLLKFTFDVREFITEPAAGVFAFIHRIEDDYAGKLLQHYHHRTTGHCSNVERQILREVKPSGGIIAAHCQVDDSGHFHTWAAFTPAMDRPLQYAQVSASTYKGVPEAILAQFDLPRSAN